MTKKELVNLVKHQSENFQIKGGSGKMKVSVFGTLEELLRMGHVTVYRHDEGVSEVKKTGEKYEFEKTIWNEEAQKLEIVEQAEFAELDTLLATVDDGEKWRVDDTCDCWICENILGWDGACNKRYFVEVEIREV